MTDIEPVLTDGQVAVLRLVADGASYAQAATALGRSESTVKRRAADAATRLGTNHITHTVAVALRLGLLEEEPAVPDVQTEREQLAHAAQLVIDQQFASPSNLQRKLGITYAAAILLLEDLEECGVVGPAEGAKPRLVLTTPAERDGVLKHIRGEA